MGTYTLNLLLTHQHSKDHNVTIDNKLTNTLPRDDINLVASLLLSCEPIQLQQFGYNIFNLFKQTYLIPGNNHTEISLHVGAN